jgi:hypothetical protein
VDPGSWLDTGVGGGKNEFDDKRGNALSTFVDEGEEFSVKASADSVVELILGPFRLDCWIVDERLASKAASASGERVCENESGGNGTLPTAGGISAGYG